MDNPDIRECRERSHALIQEVAASNPGSFSRVDKEGLVYLGKTLWSETYQNAANDGEAFQRFVEKARRTMEDPQSDPATVAMASAMVFLPMEQLLFFWACRWADQAFPVITMSHKYAAALMATSISAEYSTEIKPPFNAFLIEVPDKLLEIEDPKTQTLHAVRYVGVHYINISGSPVWSYVAMTHGEITIWRHGIPTESLTEADPEDVNSWESYSFASETTDQDSRVHILIGRMILGICLAMSDKESFRAQGKGHTYSEFTLRTSTEPLVRTYQVGLPIDVDCRQVIKDYVLGRRSSAPGVQTLVRGHWKRQPYGPQSSLRKWVHLKPFWRGPLNAPILRRVPIADKV